jgi:hypothetical protein
MPKYPISANRRGGRTAHRLSAKMWQFPAFFFEALRFYLHLLKVVGALELWNCLKTLSGSLPTFAFSNF